MEKAELSAIEQSLRENIERLQQEKESAERELNEKVEMQRKDTAREVDEYKQRLQAAESNASELQRKVY